MKAFLFFLFESINHGDLQGDQVWQQKAAVDGFSSQSCQQILIYTGQVGIGLIAMVTGHVRVPSHHGRELMPLCSACSFFIRISFTGCWIAIRKRHHTSKATLPISFFLFVSFFYHLSLVISRSIALILTLSAKTS